MKINRTTGRNVQNQAQNKNDLIAKSKEFYEVEFKNNPLRKTYHENYILNEYDNTTNKHKGIFGDEMEMFKKLKEHMKGQKQPIAPETSPIKFGHTYNHSTDKPSKIFETFKSKSSKSSLLSGNSKNTMAYSASQGENKNLPLDINYEDLCSEQNIYHNHGKKRAKNVEKSFSFKDWNQQDSFDRDSATGISSMFERKRSTSKTKNFIVKNKENVENVSKIVKSKMRQHQLQKSNLYHSNHILNESNPNSSVLSSNKMFSSEIDQKMINNVKAVKKI